MNAKEFAQLKESALRQFSMTARDGVCREGAALLTEIGMIFSGNASNEDPPGAIRNALDAYDEHKARSPGNADKFNIVAIVVAVNNQKGVVSGGTLDEIIHGDGICTDVELVAVSPDGEHKHRIDMTMVMPS